MTVTVTTPLSFQPVRLPIETASQATEPKRGADLSVSPQRSVFADEQRLQVAQDKIKLIQKAQSEIKLIQKAQSEIKLIQKAQSEIKPLESKVIATDNPINRLLDSFLQTARDDRKININSLSRELQGLSAIELPLADSSRLALQQELQALPRTRISPNEGNEDSQMISDSELWDQIAEDIGNINDNYLGVYEDVVALYTEFYQAFSEILSQMGGWITPGSDGNSVTFDSAALKVALEQLVADFEDQPLFSGTPEEALAWAEELGLPESCVVGGEVFIDMTPIQNMIDHLPPSGEIDNAAFQAWQSGFKAQEENLKNTLQTLTQKYSNANSLFDNLVKVLSSTISSCTETCKSFLQG
ncbi:MAG: type III secretion system needle tip protein SctA [Plesiomonas sp.]|uniref:type III secretion system needle tip protein SctA n=1 Tax=Plesiomonas sp. TaxID=2486279 RepID=UPI003F319DFA